MKGDLNLWALWASIANISLELARIQKDRNYKVSDSFTKDSQEITNDMQYAFCDTDTSIFNLDKKIFYGELFFGEVLRTKNYFTSFLGDIDWPSFTENHTNRKNTKGLIERRVQTTKRTIEKIIQGKRPTKKEFICAKEVFSYLDEKSNSRIPKNPYGNFLSGSRVMKSLAA